MEQYHHSGLEFDEIHGWEADSEVEHYWVSAMRAERGVAMRLKLSRTRI